MHMLVVDQMTSMSAVEVSERSIILSIPVPSEHLHVFVNGGSQRRLPTLVDTSHLFE